MTEEPVSPEFQYLKGKVITLLFTVAPTAEEIAFQYLKGKVITLGIRREKVRLVFDQFQYLKGKVITAREIWD